MNAIATKSLNRSEKSQLLDQDEGQFLDMKAKEVSPAKLTRTLSAFANADGGTLLIGIKEDKANGAFEWEGFGRIEDANGHIAALETTFPLGADFSYEFLACNDADGLVIKVEIFKTKGIRKASDGTAYVRRGAQNLPIKTPEAYQNLQRAKGIISHEDQVIGAPVEEITNSNVSIEFMLTVVPHAEPDKWLKKQRLILDGKPTVAGLLLYSEEPQVHLPKAAVKIYRYTTSAEEGTRDTLAFDPVTVEGDIYSLIHESVQKTVSYTEEIQILRGDGLRSIQYPKESLHEIITNAILHRDYSVHDDVHIRIFDNRIEVESPGRLPAHITPTNILSERFARNPKIVRLINKFPNPPNKDVGEGLNTAFEAMHKLRLREPRIIEHQNSVMVDIRHEQLASPEVQVVAFLRKHGTISNRQARQETGIESEVKIRYIFQKLMRAGEIEKVPGTIKSGTKYRVPLNEDQEPDGEQLSVDFPTDTDTTAEKDDN